MRRFIKFFVVLALIVILDQSSKLWVYANMKPGIDGQISLLGQILKLTYVLNSGMAFSIDLGFKYSKLFITILRLVVSLYIFHYIIQLIKINATVNWIWAWIFILSGAISNSIDSIFYGVYLNNAPPDSPMKWFYGQVIDMLHIDLWSGKIPGWVPLWHDYYIYFLPIFNIADVAVSTGLVLVISTFSKKNASI